MELDRLLPTYDFRSRYTRRMMADRATVWDALMGLTADELPLTRLLMGLRSAGRTRLSGPLIETFPPTMLNRAEGSELVMGKIAKFWRLRPPLAPIDPSDAAAFQTFAEPGWVKAAMGLYVLSDGDGTVVWRSPRRSRARCSRCSVGPPCNGRGRSPSGIALLPGGCSRAACPDSFWRAPGLPARACPTARRAIRRSR